MRVTSAEAQGSTETISATVDRRTPRMHVGRSGPARPCDTSSRESANYSAVARSPSILSPMRAAEALTVSQARWA